MLMWKGMFLPSDFRVVPQSKTHPSPHQVAHIHISRIVGRWNDFFYKGQKIREIALNLDCGGRSLLWAKKETREHRVCDRVHLLSSAKFLLTICKLFLCYFVIKNKLSLLLSILRFSHYAGILGFLFTTFIEVTIYHSHMCGQCFILHYRVECAPWAHRELF